MRFQKQGARIFCDSGPNDGMYRLDGSLYLTPEELDRYESGEYAMTLTRSVEVEEVSLVAANDPATPDGA